MTVVSSYTIATVLSLQTLSTCIIFTLGQYIYTFYLQTYPYRSDGISNSTLVSIPSYLQKINKISREKCIKNNLSLDSTAQAWAQQRSADLFFWTNLWSCFPIIIMTYILGLYTPKLGRRFVLLLPMFGTTIQLSIWLAIIYYHLPEYWWYIAAILVGLSGSDNVRSNVHVFPIDPFYFFVCRFRSQSIHH
jgi:MFS family permease